MTKFLTRVLLVAIGALAMLAGAAGAHIERDPIFVDPAVDESVFPPAGGAFVDIRAPRPPAIVYARFQRSTARHLRGGELTERGRAAIRSRYTRLSREQQEDARRFIEALPGDISAADLGLTDPRVQAQETIVVCQDDSMQRLRAAIGQVRSTPEGRERLPREQARRLIRDNRAYAELCRFREIHPAVMAADNNDAVLIMPGFYTEPTARSRPHNDPACADFVDDNGAPSYRYHFECPNDLSLVTLLGEDLEGNCIRCNVQVHGTGARPEDVLLEGGEGVPDPGVSGDLFEEGLGPAKGAKEVGIRVERADGAYVHNLTVRNVEEHGIYSIETDGMTVNEAKMFYAREYGHLSFVTDHNIIKNSETAGSDDGGIYPGASPPSRPRINTIVKDNYSHHNALGFSGTMGSNILIKDNRFVNNSVGISLDSFYRAGHPGFPQNSTVITNNIIAHNNFDTFGDDAWVKSSVPAAVGTGAWLVGGNDNVYKNNYVYDNWRNGLMLITVPDALSNQLSHTPQVPEDARLSTSHRNRYENNVMGRSPDGHVLPNGTDFWWDELGQGNCWEGNEAPGGVTSDPPSLPDCDDFPNVGVGNPVKEPLLAACGFAVTERDENTPACDWYQQPPKPE